MNFEEFNEKYQKGSVDLFSNQVTEYPLVSVCVQTYQQIDYIKACLNGILMQQTDFPFEILLGEDQSIDGTREICIEYAQKYPDKIRLFLRSRKDVIYINGSPTGRYNFIENLKLARGKYIAICEGDDYWTDPLKLQKQFDFLENNSEYVMAFHDAQIIDINGKLISQSKLDIERQKDRTSEEIYSGILIPSLTVMFRNNLILKYPPEFFSVKNGDIFLFALLSQYGKAKYMDNIKPGVYRKHLGGIWSANTDYEKNNSLIQSYTAIFENVRPSFSSDLLKKKLFKLNFSHVFYVKGKYSKMKQYFFSYKYFSWNINSFIRLVKMHGSLIRKFFD